MPSGLKKLTLQGMTAKKTDELLKSCNIDTLASGIGSSTDEQLIDAYILLDYYVFILKPQESENVRKARAFIGLELQKRLTKYTMH